MLEIGRKDSVKGVFSSFSVDNLGNTYLCQNDVITKLSPTFDTLFSTSLKSHFPSYIQAVKNFRVLTFDQERGIVQFFDNTLTPLTGSLNLYDLNVVQPILVCESFNGNAFWVLDAGTLRLLKINENFKVITEVENLSFIIDNGQHPTQMFEHNDLLYMLVPDRNVMVFDAFGTFIQKINIKTSWIDRYQNALLYYQFPNFYFSNKLILENEVACKWPLTAVKSFHINSKFLYLLTKAGFYRGMINQPMPTKNK
ncbi:MAG: hypothetical protein R3279_09505 [Putridiphycobacter sp.]|nr:hypothetical protein [Putridiphycobacter sp.]